MSRKTFQFTIRAHRNETFSVAAYEPFRDAPFVVHRAYGHQGDWTVTHRGTTHAVGQPLANRLTDALALAESFAELVPLAAEVTDTSGPYQELREQIIAARKTLGIA